MIERIAETAILIGVAVWALNLADSRIAWLCAAIAFIIGVAMAVKREKAARHVVERQEAARLIRNADEEHRLVQSGDSRGVFGSYTPPPGLS